jgi:hypothetical protein
MATFCAAERCPQPDRVLARAGWENVMNQLIYLIGLIVVVMAILTFLGLR